MFCALECWIISQSWKFRNTGRKSLHRRHESQCVAHLKWLPGDCLIMKIPFQQTLSKACWKWKCLWSCSQEYSNVPCATYASPRSLRSTDLSPQPSHETIGSRLRMLVFTFQVLWSSCLFRFLVVLLLSVLWFYTNSLFLFWSCHFWDISWATNYSKKLSTHTLISLVIGWHLLFFLILTVAFVTLHQEDACLLTSAYFFSLI